MRTCSSAIRCDFFKGHSTNTDSDGNKFFTFDVGLVIQDREDNKSSKTTHTVKVFPNGFCGY